MTSGQHNILEHIPALMTEEQSDCLIERKKLKIERIVSRGHSTCAGEWYDQNWDEWVLLVQGKAILRYENGPTFNLQTGDYINIPAHTRHRVDWTPPDPDTIWLAIHYEP